MATKKEAVENVVEFPAAPPVGFGYTGEFDKLPTKTREALQGHWDELSEEEKAKVMKRVAHHSYDHARFMAEQA
jgi:hypothetical protein